MNAPKTDPVSALLETSEALRAAVRGLESLELSDPQSRQDARDLIAETRRLAFVAVSLGALELRHALSTRRAMIDPRMEEPEVPRMMISRVRLDRRER